MQSCLKDRIQGWQRITDFFNGARISCVTLALILGAIGSLPLVFLIPPFQAPDEVQHFYRAYELSEFRMRAEVRNGVAGDTLPESLPLLVKSSVYTSDGILYPATPAPIAKTLELARIPLNRSARRFVAIPSSAFYSPLPYLPQVLGITVGRVIGLGPLYLLYLGRLSNCLAALALLGLAVKLAPFAKEMLIVIGLLPMSLFLYASLSPDAAIIACALLFCALSFSASARGNWRTWELGVAATAAAAFCSVKPVYAPMLLAGVVPGLFRPGEVGKVVRSHLILLAVALGVTAGWLLFAKSSMTSPLNGAHPSIQMNIVLHHPMYFVHALIHSFGFVPSLALYLETVGVFGWLTVLLWPGAVYFLPLVNLFIVLKRGVRGTVKRSAKHAFWCLSLALASAILVFAALFLMWTKVGQNDIVGVQGRYFIPILFLAGMALVELTPSRRPSASRWHSLANMTGIIVLQIIAMDATIIRAFHVF